MNQHEFDAFNKRRMESMIDTVWPLIQERLAQGMSPKDIASELRTAGYWGFASNCIGLPDIHIIWTEAMKRTDRQS